MQLHRALTIDIETLPDLRPGAEEAARSRVKAPSNYKDPAKIEEYVREKGDEAWRRTSLNGTYGQIMCIAFALADGEVHSFYRTIEEGLEGERRVLEQFWKVVGDWSQPNPLWVGQRVGAFDLRFLFQRSIIQRVKPSRRIRPDFKPWSNDVFDVSYAWTGELFGGIKLEHLAEALELPSPKDLLDGSEVYDAALRGEYDLIERYCRGDVETAREAYKLISSLDLGYEEV